MPGIEIDEGPELHGPLDPVSISPYRLFVIQKVHIVSIHPKNISNRINTIFTATVREVIPVLKEG